MSVGNLPSCESKYYVDDIGARPREEICFFLFDFMALFLLFGGDSAQLLTMGKAWYLGKLPYVDMFDHKGPFIFIVVLDALKLRRMLI